MKPLVTSQDEILPYSLGDRLHIPAVDFESSVIKVEEVMPDSSNHLAVPQPEALKLPKSYEKKKSNMKHFSTNNPSKNDNLRYSRGMSWSQEPEGLNQLQINVENPDKQMNPEEMRANNENATQPKSICQKIKSLLWKKGDLKRESELVVTINDLNTRTNYEAFIQKMNNIDQQYIKEIRFQNLKNQFLIQQWKEIELIIRTWPLNSLKFEGTRLEKEHCLTLLHFLHNKSNKIEKLSFNYNGLTPEKIQLLFGDTLKLTDLTKLKRLSIKNNPCIYQDYNTFQSFSDELKAKTKSSMGFFYKVDSSMLSKKFNFIAIDFSDNNLDDRKMKKIILGLKDNHSNNDIQSLNLSHNEKITENGWFLFTERFLTSTMRLHTLNLSHCNLDDNNFKRISEGINKNSAINLHTLDISDNGNISSSGFLFFARKVLLKCSSLEVLLMSNCGLNDVLIEGIVDGLLLSEENLEIVSQRCKMSISESVFLGERKLGLKYLDLSRNWSISDKGWLKLLMPLLSMACKLEHLKVADCVLNEDKLKVITDLVTSHHLKSFDVSENASITEILGWPLYSNSYLMKCLKLQSLNLSKSNINSEKLKAIHAGLCKNLNSIETLHEIILSYNIEIKDKDFAAFLRDLALRFVNLKTLKLRKVGLSDEKINCLLMELEKQEKPWFMNLAVLDVSENVSLGEGGLFSLCKGILKHTRYLQELFFENTELTDKKMKILVEFLREQALNSHLKSLQNLSLSNNPGLSEVSFFDLGVFLAEFQSFIERNEASPLFLGLAECKINNMKILRLIEGLGEANVSLLSLDISKNKDITNEGFKTLSQAMLFDNLRVFQLKLSDCVLNTWKLKDLAFGVHLHSLDLSENLNVSGRDFENLLSKSPNLKTLSVRKCGLKDPDLKVISQILFNNKITSSFLSINFSSNREISAIGYKSFLLAFFAKEKALNISAWAFKNSNTINMDLEVSQSVSQIKDLKFQRESLHKILNDHKFKSVCNTLAIQKAEFHMKTLDLSKNKISSHTFDEIVNKILLHSKELETLILDHVITNNKKMGILFKYLEKDSLSLKSLSLKGSKDITSEFWAQFFAIIKNIPLNSLSFDDSELNNQKVDGFISGLADNQNQTDQKKMPLNETLIHLSLGDNKKISSDKFAEFLHEFVASFPNLEELILSDCDLTDQKLKSLAIFLEKATKITRLDISGANSVSDSAFREFVAKASLMKRLKSLKVRDFHLTESKIIHLKSLYENLMNQEGSQGFTIDIEENKGISSQAISAFVIRTMKFKALERLSLLGCDLEDSTFRKIIVSFLENKEASQIKELEIGGNPQFCESYLDFFSNLSNLFPELTLLSLRDNSLNVQKVEKINTGITNSRLPSKIKSLDLTGNKQMEESGWLIISQNLLKFVANTLEKLILAECELKNHTFKFLIDGILAGKIKTLRHLDLSNNWAIHETGLSDLFSLLVLNKELQIESLSLAACTLNDSKIKTISETFSNFTLRKPSLVSLDLSFNKTISENGWKTFGLKILRNLVNLKNLNLFQCDLDCDSKVAGGFQALFERGNFKDDLESLRFSIEAANLIEGIIILQQSVHKAKVKSLTPRFNNEELLLKMFWSPLDFLIVLRKFYLKPKIDPKHIRSRHLQDDLQKPYAKTLIFEPKTFFPYVFSNPLMNRYEDIVLNEGLRVFLKENRLKSTLNSIILINYDQTANDSLLSKSEIMRIKDTLEDTSLDSVQIDYTYNYSKYNLSESEMLDFMRFLPPKAFIFKEDELSMALNQQRKSTFKKSRKESANYPRPRSSVGTKEKRSNQKITLNGLKALFALLYQNYNVSEIKIDYDYDSMLNQGIAFSLREKIYQSFFRLRICKALKFLAYKLLSLFVISAKHYKFSSDIINLNSYLQSQAFLYLLLLSFIGIYYFISMFLPFYFIKPCGNGLAWESHYIFIAFMVISLFFESVLFGLIYPRLRPVYLSFNNYAMAERKTCKSKLKRRVIILGYMALSQVAHYDLYSKFSYIRITFECQQNSLGIVATIFMGIHILITLYNYLHMIIKGCFFQNKRELNFKHIHKFLEAAHFSDFAGFYNALDVVAPYNVIQIPKSWLIRKLTPKIAGLSINSKIFFFFLKFLLKNTPIVIVQIMFLFFRRDRFGESDVLVFIALIFSLLVFCVDFYKFMSVRPSTIYQGDFDELVRRNKKKRLEWIKENIQERDRVLDLFINNSDKELKLAMSMMIETELMNNNRKKLLSEDFKGQEDQKLIEEEEEKL